MTPRTFDVKFPCGTQLNFGSLTFIVGEDEYLKMLSPGMAHLVSLEASGGSCSGSDPFERSYI
jgi:hypothetical protein